MRREPIPFLRKDTSEIIAESRADLHKALASQTALRDLIVETREKINFSKDLLSRIAAVLSRVNGAR